MTSRKYTSELRESQTQVTRDRILDAVVEVLAEGVDSLSMPAVAARAGVSVGTVYNHFGDKAGLLKALVPYAAKRTGTHIESIPETLAELDDTVRQVFHHFDRTDDLLRAAFTSRLGRETRVQGTPERLEAMKVAVRQIEPDLTPDAIDHMARLMLILTTSDVYQQWTDRLGLNPEEAADEVMWTLRTVLRGIQP